jgi:hypothetical protein
LTTSLVSFTVSDVTGLQATINWGDGQTSAGVITALDGGRYTVTGTHTYAQPGYFGITVSFSRGGLDQASQYVSVQVAPADPPDQQFVSQVYLNLLGRSADPVGLAAWVGVLQRGYSRPQVVQMIEGTVEYHTREVGQLFQSLLGRSAGAAGLAAFQDFLAAGGTLAQIKAAILSSPEYFAHAGGTNTAFLQALYRDTLGRGLDPVGAATWGDKLSGGGSRAAVVLAVLNSLEANQVVVQSLYQDWLHRPVDGNNLTAIATALQGGYRQEALVANIVGSPEFMARA